ncbi:hypothetical protein C4546_03390 [Candidatus Parcubacteria bacterium]|jgi:hypothetical protein|nr:MAG: hypothetical protein C4546_03390 [Candidatus Parcubacteria bacterium]
MWFYYLLTGLLCLALLLLPFLDQFIEEKKMQKKEREAFTQKLIGNPSRPLPDLKTLNGPLAPDQPVYYCPICFLVSAYPDVCPEHDYAEMRLGNYHALKFYQQKQKLYFSESPDDSPDPRDKSLW